MTDRNAGPDADFERTVRDLIDSKTKPLGALGQVEAVALQLARATGTVAPRLDSCELTIFVADHGIAAERVSAYPQAVTREMVLNFLNRGAAASVFAEAVGASVRVVDAGVAGEPIDHPDLVQRRIGPGTRNCLAGPAMTGAQCDDALQAGRQLAEGSPADVLCFGEMGIGNTSAATLLAHKLLGLPVADLAGRGTGLDDAGLAHKTAVLEAAAARTAPDLSAAQALAEYGGFEIAMMAGAMLGAAQSNRPVLVDGFIATAAAVVALGIEPAVRRTLIYAHRSAEHGHRTMLDVLAARPILDLEMRLGEGTGALLAWPVVRSASAMLTDMASFESAGVSGPA
ncbi:MAG: nicotinate-nucleotide--dimethylbenzimidazole phosphoribosyltransferase [Rhodospirillaceae bacterium]|nr:nicotinate-nucleotide--dimethylbenzimidazole phosphoribosyltransferase [Rhodospirillaceae bacterium]MYH38918.1 nicotinate-nucleotide--dimethylbenzimidazole phosphoribosyltransferase [Rhodospirillaceae bacterium]MYK15617.1 nicotinate-nucleotide--dimethylbenzimidazole phosphoribosyltransferase [Rhodospirillaceae bacterium]MYK57694.1 nicotinate-nucleotide--dimethylbenzimidazole phosphoribosyltransferase [Rhodospirillaceae bacterium]